VLGCLDSVLYLWRESGRVVVKFKNQRVQQVAHPTVSEKMNSFLSANGRGLPRRLPYRQISWGLLAMTYVSSGSV